MVFDASTMALYRTCFTSRSESVLPWSCACNRATSSASAILGKRLIVRRPRSCPVSIASMSFSNAWVASSPSVLTAAASLAILARLVALSRPISAMMSFCTLVVASAAA